MSCVLYLRNNIVLERPVYSFYVVADMLRYGPRSDKRYHMANKSKVGFLEKKINQAIVNNYRKFEEIIFTNSKDTCMSV